MKKNISTSVPARLLNLAKAEGSSFNAVLVRYGLERLLYRISQSGHANQFLLKGALLFNLWYDMPHRATRDIDLLGFGDNDLQVIQQIFSEICSIDVEDGLVFLSDTIVVSIIKKNTGYSGARVELFGELAKARVKIQVDIGYGDAVTPGPIEAVYPVLIEDFPAPKIRTYPVYTVISEKLHAIALLGMANSRLKDYLDLFVLLENEVLNQGTLARAIAATFARRGTVVTGQFPVGLTEQFSNDSSRQSIWHAFLNKNELEAIALPLVVLKLQNHLRQPLIESALATEDVKLKRQLAIQAEERSLKY